MDVAALLRLPEDGYVTDRLRIFEVLEQQVPAEEESAAVSNNHLEETKERVQPSPAINNLEEMKKKSRKTLDPKTNRILVLLKVAHLVLPNQRTR